MKKTISMLLCCAMLGTLCACQHGGDYEKRTYVPQFDMTVSYGFEDEELKSDDGTTYYRQSLGTATVSSKDERAAERINSSLAELYVKFGADAEYTRRVAEDQTDGEQIALSYYCAPSVTRCDTRVLSAVFDVSQDIGGIHDSVNGTINFAQNKKQGIMRSTFTPILREPAAATMPITARF